MSDQVSPDDANGGNQGLAENSHAEADGPAPTPDRDGGETELSEARERTQAANREKELAGAREQALAEAHSARALLTAREAELAEARAAELAAARHAREAAEERERRLEEEREKERSDSRRFADRAEAREKDQASRERTLEMARWARHRAYFLGGLAFAFAFTALAVLGQVLGGDLGMGHRTRLLATLCLSAVAFLFLVGALLLPRFLDARKVEREVERHARESAHEALEELADAADLPALIRANRKQMEAYDILARAQAKTAFRNSQVAMGAGLLVLFFGAVIAIAADDTTSKITTASLTAIGGMLAGFIARTFLRTYSRALRQLNFYFQQPLINSYLLNAQRLIKEMSKDKRDAALAQVIENVMAVVIRLPWSGAELEKTSERHTPGTSADSDEADRT